MVGKLKVVTAPTVEPVALSEAKAHLHVTHDLEDLLIGTYIKAARERAESFQGRAYITQTLERSLDQYPVGVLKLPRAPVTEVSSVKYYDSDDTESSVTLTDLDIDTDNEPARIALAYGKTWPTTTLRNVNGFKVRYTVGYGGSPASVPGSVRAAILLYVGHMFENRAGEIPEPPVQYFHLLESDKVWL